MLDQAIRDLISSTTEALVVCFHRGDVLHTTLHIVTQYTYMQHLLIMTFVKCRTSWQVLEEMFSSRRKTHQWIDSFSFGQVHGVYLDSEKVSGKGCRWKKCSNELDAVYETEGLLLNNCQGKKELELFHCRWSRSRDYDG